MTNISRAVATELFALGGKMPFQPLGYPFEVDLHLQPTNAKLAIRKRLKPWFEAKSGARGWIMGPFICLWFSAFDRYGPMLFGTIQKHGLGTRISGRAGSDLNGISALLGLTAVLLVVFGSTLLNGLDRAELSGWLFPLFLALFVLPLLLWLSHKDRRQAEPLVRFLKETVSGPRHKTVRQLCELPILPELALDVDGDIQQRPLTATQIAEALQSIEDDGFLILSSSQEDYIQTAAGYGNFVIEKRNGGADSHVEAVRADEPHSTWLKRDFTFDETLAALLAYASGAPMPAVVEWRPMS